MKYSLLLLFLINAALVTYSQTQKFGFDKVLAEAPNEKTTFCVPNDAATRALLERERITIKYGTSNWLFITTTPSWIDQQSKSNALKNYYFEFAPPAALADTARLMHVVDPVHLGTGLTSPYTGKNVIIGYVDQGIDFTHPDFLDSTGKTRVLRYWDHSTNVGGTIPQPYNYGIVWDSAAINNGTCTSTEESTAHGSTVAGMGSGNGRANGTNKGMAPESNIIIVETNFNLPNWTLTVADACDYIFKVADTLGMPAVVNLSLGTYLGSHDGNDPAAEYMESLLDAKSGRIIVCAAGNSGNFGKNHVTGIVDADTSFVWFLNNPSSVFGPNKIYFDLWSDVSDATFDFAYGADRPSPTYGFRGRSNFRSAQGSINVPVFDTIYNASGQRIATIETYTEIVGNNFHMQGFFRNVDSTNYLFRFMTKGSGKYDVWSGVYLGLNNMVVSIPSPVTVPDIVHYHLPDSLQSIVSSWNCSEKVVSVGNMRSRLGHIDRNFAQYYPSGDMTTPGKLSKNSSKGPTRHALIKPDVTASGDVTLAAAPLWMLSNPAYYPLIDSGGWHARNGGTSMASPVVAGIASLYLQKCDKARYSDFKTDLIASSYTDAFTGVVPNNAYGYGKPHAHNLLLNNEFTANIFGEDSICEPELWTATSATSLLNAYWSNGDQGLTSNISNEGPLHATIYSAKGCKFESDTFNIVQLEVLPILPILQLGNTLASLSFTNYQWTLDGTDIPGATNSTLDIAPPYGTYTCYCVSSDGCISETDPLQISVGLNEYEMSNLSIYPNPTKDVFELHAIEEISGVRLYSADGKEQNLKDLGNNKFSIAHLPLGIYHMIIQTKTQKIQAKITRM